MSELAERLDLSRYVPINYPEVIAYKSETGCFPTTRSCNNVPCYTKEFFCSEWGQNFRCICPPRRSNCSLTGVKKELASLDYFTRIPDNPNRKYPFPQYQSSRRYRTMAERYGLEDVHDCPRVRPRWSHICPENRKSFNLLHKDTICGVCVPPQNASKTQLVAVKRCGESQSSQEDMYDLPFCVTVGSYPVQKDRKRSRSPHSRIAASDGVRASLQPSNFHDLQSVHRDSFQDYYKLKTDKELNYYRSPLAIDPRRPPLTLPSNNKGDLVVSGPLTVSAVPLVMRPKEAQKLPRNLGPKFQVIVQGPICI